MASFRGIQGEVRNPSFRFFGDDQCRQVHEATLNLLEKTGVWIDNSECLEMLRAAGARILDVPAKDGSKYTRRVQMPAQMVEDAIRSAPQSVTIHNRRGEVAMVLEEYRSYFGFFGDNHTFIDPETNERRQMSFRDIGNQAALVDYLPNADWILAVGNCADMPLKHSYQGCTEAILRNTVKPMAFCSGDVAVVSDIVDMASAICGSRDQALSKPFIICVDEPITPLLHDPDSIQRITMSAQLALPLIYVPMPMIGTSTPCNPMGGVLVGNAESLSGLVIHQLTRQGSPYIYGALPSSVDMRLGSFNYGAPELAMMCSGIADMAHYYKLPVWGTGGCCDSNFPDAQAGAEATFSLLSAVLAGANLIHDLAIFSQGLCITPGFALILDEVVSMVKRFMEGFEISADTLNLDLIDEVGPGGTFITHDHTYRNFKSLWSPRVFDRTAYEMLDKNDMPEAGERAQKQAAEIIRTHTPEPIAPGALKDLEAVTERWQSR